MNPDEIKKLRKVTGLGQEKFGALIGVAGMTVYRWEVGRTEPSQLALKALNELKKSLRSKGKKK